MRRGRKDRGRDGGEGGGGEAAKEQRRAGGWGGEPGGAGSRCRLGARAGDDAEREVEAWKEGMGSGERWRQAEKGGSKGTALDGPPRIRSTRSSSPVSARAYLQGLGLRPRVQSALSAARAAACLSSPAAPLASRRRIRAERGPCAPPAAARPRPPACARPRLPARAGTGRGRGREGRGGRGRGGRQSGRGGRGREGRSEEWGRGGEGRTGERAGRDPAGPGGARARGLRGPARAASLRTDPRPLRTGVGDGSDPLRFPFAEPDLQEGTRWRSIRDYRVCPVHAPPPLDWDSLWGLFPGRLTSGRLSGAFLYWRAVESRTGEVSNVVTPADGGVVFL